MIKYLFTALLLLIYIQIFSQAELSSIKHQSACASITDSDLADIMDWRDSSITKDEYDKQPKFTVCNYTHGDDKLMIRLGWKSEAAIDNKVLENQYKTYLSKGENGLSYQELANSGEVQSLKGQGEVRGNQINYILRKRYGNKASIQIEYTTSKDQPNAHDRLLKIADSIK